MSDIEIKEKYLKFFERQRDAGARILAYKCPYCGESIDTLVPGFAKESWDTMSECPHCGELHWKDARRDSVAAYRLPSR